MLYHRLVLYEKIGPGQHPCNYCGETVEWKVGQHTQRGNLIAEHVDGDTTNNDPENLRHLCQRCHLTLDAAQHAQNARRTRIARREAAGQTRLPE